MAISWRGEQIHASESGSAYHQWFDDDDANRRTMLTTLEGMTPWFRSQEAESNERAFGGSQNLEDMYGDEGYEDYMEKVGLIKEEYWPRISASMVKDSVSIFEIYLERSAWFILENRGWTTKYLGTEGSWRWEDCCAFYEHFLGINLESSDLGLESARWIRNKVTHLQNRLRTDKGANDLATHRSMLALDAGLTEEESALKIPNRNYWDGLSGVPNLGLSPLDAWRISEILSRTVQDTAYLFYLAERYNLIYPALDELEQVSEPEKPFSKLLVRRKAGLFEI